MKKVTKPEVIEIVKGFHDAGQKWHYHLLTPTCQFNESQQYALFVENVETGEVVSHYSDEAEMELSSQFSKMLQGSEVMDQKNTSKNYEPTPDVAAILELINNLTERGVTWHHHVFFPGCTFNGHSNKFELVVENPESDERLMSVSETEPKEDLKQIESVFYAQDTA